MKILFLSHNFFPFIGGIETNSEILSAAFFKAGHDLRVLTWTDDPDEKKYPFPVIRNPSFKILFQQNKWADLVFENNPCLRLAWPNIFFNRLSVIALNTWVSRIDEVTGMHGEIGLPDRLKFLWLKKADRVIAVSDAIRKHSFKNSIVISNPYRSNTFKIDGSIKKTKAFVFLGRLVSNKGVDQAIMLMAKLIEIQKSGQFLPVSPTLTIIGDGPEKGNLQNLVAKHQLESYVNFTGPLTGKTLVDSLNEHVYLLVPSLWEEPFGTVVLEGMACGCLPIVSDGGGLPDAIGDAGISFKRGDLDNMLNCVLNLFKHPELEEKLRNAAPAHLLKHQPKNVADKYLEVINSLQTPVN